MREPDDSKFAALLPRIPVLVLGLVIAASSVQASCGGTEDTGGGDAATSDSPSEDSPANRADGMSYGDAYGQ